MARTHKIVDGDSTSSLAYAEGLNAESVWNHPENAALKEQRAHMDILSPGDDLYLPDLVEKTETRATDLVHRFKRIGVPAKTRLQILVGDDPRANEAYVFRVGKRIRREGTTDGEGVLEEFVPPNATRATVFFPADGSEYAVSFGTLDPIETVRGVQKRLNNLGYDSGAADGEIGEKTRAALAAFQRDLGLETTGALTDETRDALAAVHDTDDADALGDAT